jgi:hypothetical protein
MYETGDFQIKQVIFKYIENRKTIKRSSARQLTLSPNFSPSLMEDPYEAI